MNLKGRSFLTLKDYTKDSISLYTSTSFSCTHLIMHPYYKKRCENDGSLSRYCTAVFAVPEEEKKRFYSVFFPFPASDFLLQCKKAAEKTAFVLSSGLSLQSSAKSLGPAARKASVRTA